MPQQTYIFLGPQGCGKGTQLKLLADRLKALDPGRDILQPAMGNMLRELAASGSYTGSLLSPILAQGGLVEYAVSVSAFGHYLMERMRGNEHVLIDGFPRTMEQATLIDSFMRFYKRESPTVIRIEIPDEEALKRLMSRGRSDDKPESIRARLAWSRAAEKELEVWFKANAAYRFVEIDGMGTIDETQAKICAAIGLA